MPLAMPYLHGATRRPGLGFLSFAWIRTLAERFLALTAVASSNRQAHFAQEHAPFISLLAPVKRPKEGANSDH